jgi:hypothetical protein
MPKSLHHANGTVVKITDGKTGIIEAEESCFKVKKDTDFFSTLPIHFSIFKGFF